jgi:uncharacterized protein (TIGR03437 family)
MRLILAALLLSAPLYAQICDYTVNPLSASAPAAASTGQVSVTTQAGCGWSATSNNSWLHITSGLGYNSSGNATYTVDANISAFARSGTLTIAARTVTVNQAAASCSFDIAPKSQNIAVGGGTGSFAVIANCAWQASSNNGAFITLPPDSRGAADGSVSFTVAANGCVAGRSSGITVNTGLTIPPPPVFTITQDGSQANLTLSATSATAAPEAGDGRITVTTGLGCSWSAVSDVSWMLITSGSSGSGNGFIAYHLLANSTAPRTGTIRVGSLTYTLTQSASGPPVPTITSVNSAANYRTDAVSPGEIVTLFGANMGPAKLVTLQVTNGAVTNSLAGTQVLFDGVAAPMVYTRNDQVSAIVPYGVAGKSNTEVQVIYNGLKSSSTTMPVQAAHPAIFTLDATGIGPGAILNQDTSINAAANPAARLSVVAIYATGGGATNPQLADGAVTGSTLPYLAQFAATTATIGGIDARVMYAGGVPSAVAGLTQINVEVPAGVATGSVVPVVVKIGGFTSSPNVTLAVR